MEQETLEPISASVSVLFEMDSLARIEIFSLHSVTVSEGLTRLSEIILRGLTTAASFRLLEY